jgi:hypothetical protein
MSSQYTSLGLGWKPGNRGRPITADTNARDVMTVDGDILIITVGQGPDRSLLHHEDVAPGTHFTGCAGVEERLRGVLGAYDKTSSQERPVSAFASTRSHPTGSGA